MKLFILMSIIGFSISSYSNACVTPVSKGVTYASCTVEYSMLNLMISRQELQLASNNISLSEFVERSRLQIDKLYKIQVECQDHLSKELLLHNKKLVLDRILLNLKSIN